MKKSALAHLVLNRQLLLLAGVVLSFWVLSTIALQVSANSTRADKLPSVSEDQKTDRNREELVSKAEAKGLRREARQAAKDVAADPAKVQQKEVTKGTSYRHDTSPPLRKMVQIAMRGKFENEEHEDNKNPKIPHRHIDVPDRARENSIVSRLMLTTPSMPGTALNFDGIGFPGVACNCSPPDTNGDVGATQYVQMVNEGYQVFNKSTGASVLGPASINSLWSGFGGGCQDFGSGDPVVLYDQIANRWLISQFASTVTRGTITEECIAISTTSDATGSYNRYGFHLGTDFFDYPHLGMWPDGYYMSMNVFNTAGTSFLGPQAFAFDRTAMLAGTAATFVTPGITGGASEDSFLPADLDGSTLPAAGSACPFVEAPFGGTYKTFLFHADFATPANSTFLPRTSPTAAGFTALCDSCVPQSGTTVVLDTLSDRLMHRLPYRIVGGVESVVGNFTVSANGVAGIRWFELRNVTSGAETLFQESTFQPDAVWRWMGSAAQDQAGNLAIGYAASSASVNPQIRYAGRLAGEALNTLGQGEVHLIDGTGSQTSSGHRWGDYSSLTVDPVDDCTFWYTQEYYATTANVNWRTRIGSFKYPSCNGTAAAALDVLAPIVTTGNNLIEPSECNTVNLPVINRGNAPATSVVATLSTTTPGVTITQPVSPYANVAGNAGTQVNTTPFQISTDNTIACFSTINLTLSLTYSGGTSPAVMNFTLPVGQANPNYAFTQTTGATIPATGTLVPSSQTDDLVVSTTTPFAFTLYGTAVASGQTIRVSTNGNIQFVSTGGSSTEANVGLPTSAFGASAIVLMPYWDDLDMTPSVAPDGGIYTETTGVAPNRIFKVEWRARHFVTGQASGPLDTDFAVLFHENSDNVEYIYDKAGLSPNQAAASATIGLQLGTSGNNFTQFSANTASIFNGMKLSAIRPPATCAAGSGACGAATPSPTPTPVPMVSIAVDTSPTGRPFTVDGTAYSTAQNFNWVRGSSHTIATDTPQIVTGAAYNWGNWSDGGAISHSVSPTVNTSYTSNFGFVPDGTPVTVSGRIVTSNLVGLRNAMVSMTVNGVLRTVTTSSFGFFSFDNVATGQQYTFRVQSKLYRYSPVVVTVTDTVTLADFVGLE